MTHELLKELKDAGFPQHLDEPTIDDDMTQVVSPETHSYVPTLSELIDECGKNFISLWRYEDQWEMIAPSGDSIVGATPEEAVARLWLALNKK